MAKRAGDLNQRVRLEKVEQVEDGGGGWVDSWVPAAPPLWAEVLPLNGVERLQAEQVASQVSYRVALRWRPDITNHMRIIWRGRVLEIVAVADAGPAAFLELDCKTDPGAVPNG